MCVGGGGDNGTEGMAAMIMKSKPGGEERPIREGK